MKHFMHALAAALLMAASPVRATPAPPDDPQHTIKDVWVIIDGVVKWQHGHDPINLRLIVMDDGYFYTYDGANFVLCTYEITGVNAGKVFVTLAGPGWEAKGCLNQHTHQFMANWMCHHHSGEFCGRLVYCGGGA